LDADSAISTIERAKSGNHRYGRPINQPHMEKFPAGRTVYRDTCWEEPLEFIRRQAAAFSGIARSSSSAGSRREGSATGTGTSGRAHLFCRSNPDNRLHRVQRPLSLGDSAVDLGSFTWTSNGWDARSEPQVLSGYIDRSRTSGFIRARLYSCYRAIVK